MNPTTPARRPATDEFAGYFRQYVEQAPDGEIVAALRDQGATSCAYLEGLAPERHEHRYADGKWTLKEVVCHVVDIEWIFSARALRIARGDTTPLPSVDQDVLIAGADVAARALPAIVEEWRHLRAANTALFASFDEAVLDRRGEASGHEVSVRAIAYVIAGHAAHHMHVIRERYL